MDLKTNTKIGFDRRGVYIDHHDKEPTAFVAHLLSLGKTKISAISSRKESLSDRGMSYRPAEPGYVFSSLHGGPK